MTDQEPKNELVDMILSERFVAAEELIRESLQTKIHESLIQRKEVVAENLAANIEEEKQDYESFFKSAMKKFGISSPADLKTDAKKKEFFDYVDKNFKGVKESRLVEADEYGYTTIDPNILPGTQGRREIGTKRPAPGTENDFVMTGQNSWMGSAADTDYPGKGPFPFPGYGEEGEAFLDDPSMPAVLPQKPITDPPFSPVGPFNPKPTLYDPLNPSSIPVRYPPRFTNPFRFPLAGVEGEMPQMDPRMMQQMMMMMQQQGGMGGMPPMMDPQKKKI